MCLFLCAVIHFELGCGLYTRDLFLHELYDFDTHTVVHKVYYGVHHLAGKYSFLRSGLMELAIILEISLPQLKHSYAL